MNWWKDLKIKVGLNEPLKNHTTFRIGGPAEYFIRPQDTGELKLLLKRLKSYKIRFLVIGAGSNILAADKGLKLAVLRLDSPFFKKMSVNGRRIRAAAAVTLKELTALAQRNSLSGLEFLSGIPAELAGSLIMNAGAWGSSIADYVESARVMDYNGRIRLLKKENMEFGYRRSNLSRYIILDASLKLSGKNKQEIENRMLRYMEYRRESQDLSRPSAGCIFKNPEGESAGKLIDQCGLKGKRIGGAVISKAHANFILNDLNAGSQDVLKLMNLARKEVDKKFHIKLEPEIKIWK